MSLELLLAAAALATEPAPSPAVSPSVVVTFDNGGFNTPFFAPRWRGFAQPSAAREVAAAVARVAGRNPAVFTYLPPGGTPGRPGDPYAVLPRLPGCAGAAEKPGDPCWCGPGDRCWADLDANHDAGASTSLYLTAARLREHASGPRIEVHFTDLFEEDPSAAENPADSDRCVTRAGARRAIEALLQVGEGASLDHLAVGLLRARLDAPPPGGSRGLTYALTEAEGGCWTGTRTGDWTPGRAPLDWGMAVVILGVGTADAKGEVAAFLDGLDTQLDSEGMSLSLVRLREPAEVVQGSGTVDAGDVAGWAPPGPSRPRGVPCDTATARAELTLDEQPLQGGAHGDCAGAIRLEFPEDSLRRAWVRAHGLWPLAGDGQLVGRVTLTGDTTALEGALGALAASNDGIADRPVPFLAELRPGTAASRRPWGHTLDLSLRVGDLDRRPWGMSLVAGLGVALVAAILAYRMLLRIHADRAYRTAWGRSVGGDGDPLRQRPVAVVIAEAQREVRSRWLLRLALAAVVAGGVAIAVSFTALELYVVANG